MARWFTLAGSKSCGPGRAGQAGTTACITRALTSGAEASYRPGNLGATSSHRMEAMCSNLAGKLSDSAVFSYGPRRVHFGTDDAIRTRLITVVSAPMITSNSPAGCRVFSLPAAEQIVQRAHLWRCVHL
jgi:hypothetical protein